jgi:predicted tellurium resistance membrane protein TerC
MVESLIALVALSLMEIVLGIDNIVFISILTSKLPLDKQSLGRRLGLLLALVTRLILLSTVFWIAQLIDPIIMLTDWLPPIEYLQSYFNESHGYVGHLPHATETVAPTLDQEAWDEFNGISYRDLILLLGGLFLIYNSVREIHHEMDGAGESHAGKEIPAVSFRGIMVRIAIMDIVFSLDSVITAVGMADQLWIMFVAVILAVGVMVLFANQVGNFVDQNPTVKMLALNFLLLIGVMLVAEGIGTPISKGYIYFAMAFSLLVEFFNIRIRKASLSKV